MKPRELTREEMLAESRRIYTNLSNRLKRIQKIENAPEYALLRFRELQENSPRDIRKLNDKELRKYYRQLKYINNLKSSRVENIRRINEAWKPIESTLKYLSKDSKAKFWELYKKIYEETGISKLYKYDIFSFIQMEMLCGKTDVEELINKIDKIYRETSIEIPEVESNEFSIRFTDELYNLLYNDI